MNMIHILILFFIRLIMIIFINDFIKINIRGFLMSFRTRRVLMSTPLIAIFEFFLMKYLFLLFGGLDDSYLLLLTVLFVLLNTVSTILLCLSVNRRAIVPVVGTTLSSFVVRLSVTLSKLLGGSRSYSLSNSLSSASPCRVTASKLFITTVKPVLNARAFSWAAVCGVVVI